MAKENLEPTPQIEEQPTPQISGEQGGETSGQPSGTAVDLKTILDSPEFEEYIDRKVQSKSDRRLGQYQTRLDNLEEAISQYDNLVNSGMSKEQAVAKMRGDQELADIKAKLESLEGGTKVADSAGAGQPSWRDQEASILQDVGVDKNDQRFIDFLKNETFESHDAYIKALDAKSFEWRNENITKPKPSASTIAQTVPGAVPVEGDFADVSDDDLGARALELGKEYTKNKAEIDRINEELERRDKQK